MNASKNDTGALRALVARLRASAWASIAVKTIGIAAALTMLAWIGHTATARATPSAATTANSDLDASVVLPAEAADAAPAIPHETPPVPPALPAAPAGSTRRASADDPVFLNRADEAELRRLPGVGPKRAAAILALRRRLGRFSRVEDLARVKGIGRAAIKKWRPLVRLDTPAAVDAGTP